MGTGTANANKGVLKVKVYNGDEQHPVENARLTIADSDHDPVTDAEGVAYFRGLKDGSYEVQSAHFSDWMNQKAEVKDGKGVAYINIDLGVSVQFSFTGPDGKAIHDSRLPRVRDTVTAHIHVPDQRKLSGLQPFVQIPKNWHPVSNDTLAMFTTVREQGIHDFEATLLLGRISDVGTQVDGGQDDEWPTLSIKGSFEVERELPLPISTPNPITVAKARTDARATPELSLDLLIRKSTEAMGFKNYSDLIELFFCRNNTGGDNIKSFPTRFTSLKTLRSLPFSDTDSYRLLKAATEAFVMVNCAAFGNDLSPEEIAYINRRSISVPDGGFGRFDFEEETSDGKMLPYLAIIRRKLGEVPVYQTKRGQCSLDEHANLCYGVIQQKLAYPCMIELIWSYWHEEGMLVQTMNAISRRIQNVQGRAGDPLANLEVDALRPLNNLLWTYMQEEQNRLSVRRRGYEYDHEYGLRLDGKALQDFRPADSRSKFLEAFHVLLRRCTAFYRQDDDTNIKADAFPVLNSLKEVHLILSEGANNQFGDLPSTSRVEMLMQQWLLARPEFREFLPTRLMVAYPEPWMDRVDAMKKLQGWTDTSVMHFNSLAVFGEQLLLSVRYGNWSVAFEPEQAFNWARFWRPQIQGYIHSYRAVTGVDLTDNQPDPAADGTLPSILLRRRLAAQGRAG